MKVDSVFQRIAKKFNVEFTELASYISHNQIAGEAREYALQNLLTKYLPNRVGVDRGFVIDIHGKESKQMDIVIYDKTVGTVFEINGVKYFPCETVIAVGEVKSDIKSTKKLQDALDKIKSAKELDRTGAGKNEIVTGPGFSLKGIKFDPDKNHRDQILGFIFTSDSLKRDTLIKYLQVYNQQTDRRYWLNLYCDYNNYLLSYEIKDALSPSAMDAKYMYCTKPEEIEKLLSLFIAILANFVNMAHVARPIYFKYANIEETEATYHDLTPKKDYVQNP